MLPELIKISFIGGALALERAAGWNLMLSQPLVGACLTGLVANPGPDWERWALRIPLAVGAILQLLLTDRTLPAATRPRDTATAAVVGTAVAMLGLPRLHPSLAISAGGILWVVIGVAAGLLSAVLGGWFARLHRSGPATIARADALAEAGAFGAFDWLYTGGLLRAFLVGAAWAWGGTILFLWVALTYLPRFAPALTARRAGVVFATLLGAAAVAAFSALVRRRPHGMRWAALGALVTGLVLQGLGAKG
jgi:mannose/fructose/N-acetylgalactosamine-specific phosphotransferase system component IIC